MDFGGGGGGKRVVVIGGGVAGSLIAKSLQFNADVTLIDPYALIFLNLRCFYLYTIVPMYNFLAG